MTKWLICLTILIACTSQSKETTVSISQLEQYHNNKSKPTRKLVLRELRRLHVKHPRIVLAQSMLETGHYKSIVCKTHNNLFGFRTKNGYIRFKNWKDCCAYYKRWQDRHYKQKHYKSYYGFLNDIGYAEDPNYTTKVKTLIDEHNRQ